MLYINSGDSSFTVKKIKNEIRYYGSNFCLANFFDEYLFVIGLSEHRGISCANVSRYDIYDERWGKMPELNEGRADASACSLGDNIYVIGGYYSLSS